jgi:hypothetical protein
MRELPGALHYQVSLLPEHISTYRKLILDISDGRQDPRPTRNLHIYRVTKI